MHVYFHEELKNTSAVFLDHIANFKANVSYSLNLHFLVSIKLQNGHIAVIAPNTQRQAVSNMTARDTYGILFF